MYETRPANMVVPFLLCGGMLGKFASFPAPITHTYYRLIGFVIFTTAENKHQRQAEDASKNTGKDFSFFHVESPFHNIKVGIGL